MPPKKITLVTSLQHQNQRLDHVLANWLPQALNQPISKGKVRKLIVAGAVYLNGHRVRIASKELMAKAKIDVYVDLARLNSDSSKNDRVFEMSADRILFEDNHIIVIDKPPGIPTQPTLDEARDNLFAAVKKFMAVRAKVALPQIYLGLHHRLDRDTSGVILFTKTVEANPGVAQIFSEHLAQKTYNALSFKTPATSAGPNEWATKNYLAKSKQSGKKSFYNSVRSGGDFAHTDFRALEDFGQAMWVEAKPRTGRTHQIRVHLSEQGLPILGDATYGREIRLEQLKIQKIPRLMLHAVSLTFPHPIHKNEISIQSPLPGDFKQCLLALQKGSRSS